MQFLFNCISSFKIALTIKTVFINNFFLTHFLLNQLKLIHFEILSVVFCIKLLYYYYKQNKKYEKILHTNQKIFCFDIYKNNDKIELRA